MSALLLDPSRWFQLAIASAALVAYASRRRLDAAAAMNRCFGVVLVVMATGHVTAISYKLAHEALPATTSQFAIPMGILLALPALWLAVRPASERAALALNGWLAGALVVLGPSAPLAIPALLNIAHVFRHGRALLVAQLVVYGAMFVASFFVPSF